MTSIPERCNRDAWRSYPNGYRVCRNHARVNDPDETLHENSIGPCDYPMDAPWPVPWWRAPTAFLAPSSPPERRTP
jgi:hypothetical protein